MGSLAHTPTPRNHILEHSVWDTSENECDQIPLVIGSWGQVESFAFSLLPYAEWSIVPNHTVSTHASSDAVTHYLLPNALDSYQLLTPPQATLLLFIPIYVLFWGCYTHFFIPQHDESVERLQTAGEAGAGRAELSWSLPQFPLKAT